MIHSTGKDRERLTGDESVGRFSILSVYHVQKLASDKAQNLQSDGKASINQKLHSKERKIMATMYVCNIPTNETVNLRKKPGGTVLVRVPYGKAVEASPSSTTGWHNATYNGYTGYIMSKYLDATQPSGGSTGGNTNPGTSSGNLTVDQYISNLKSYCNDGWKYCSSGYNETKKIVDCANYPYLARNKQGGKGCTTEYNSYLSEKVTIASLGGYNALQVGMEIFQQDTKDSTKKGHMGVYAGMQTINGKYQHAVYQSCSSHNTIDAMYNNGDSEDSGPNLTGMNNKWKYWGWSKYINH